MQNVGFYANHFCLLITAYPCLTYGSINFLFMKKEAFFYNFITCRLSFSTSPQSFSILTSTSAVNGGYKSMAKSSMPAA